MTIEMDIIIVKFLNHQSTAEENSVLLKWIEESPDNKCHFISIQKLYVANKVNRELSEEEKAESEKILDNIIGDESYGKIIQIQKRRRRNLWRYISSAAAIVILLLSVGLYDYFQNRSLMLMKENVKLAVIKPQSPTLVLSNGKEIALSELNSNLEDVGVKIQKEKSNGLSYSSVKNAIEVKFNTLKVPIANTFQITLSDGTKVWLNSDSELKYPLNFVGNERRVFLKGEAYFEVSKQSNKAPFIVESENLQTKVLGTHFNISCYDNDITHHVTLSEGSVSVGINSEQTILAVGDQIRYNQNDQTVITQQVDPTEYNSWIDGQTWFHNIPLNQLTTMIKRFYGINILLNDESLSSLRFSGKLLKSYDPKEIIELISESADLEWSVEKDAIVLFRNKH